MRYTFASGWRGKGVGGVLCDMAECGNKRFFAAAGQADFVTWVAAQSQDFEKQNPTGRRRKQRYIQPSSRRSDAPVSALLPLPFAVGHSRFPALADRTFHVLGLFEDSNQRSKLFFCERVVWIYLHKSRWQFP